MSTVTRVAPNRVTQELAAWSDAVDSSSQVHNRVGGAFAAHEQSTPVMTVRIDAGAVLNGVTLTEVAAQSTGTITAPVTNPRIDRIVIDGTTGAVSVITGVEGASPSAPAITTGKYPCAQVLLATSTTTITNSLITDERIDFHSSGLSIGVTAGSAQQVDQAETSTASATTVTLGTTLKHLITGTTTITAFNGVSGVTYHCTAGAAFLLTHHATNLDILQTGANITTAADDTFDVYTRTGTTCEIRNYQRASGSALATTGTTIAAQQSTASGTAFDFTGIPDTTKEIIVMFDSNSLSGTDNYLVQLGDAGGFENSGYVSSSAINGIAGASSTAGFIVRVANATPTMNGNMHIYLMDSATNKWNADHTLIRSDDASYTTTGAGTKSLSAVLTQVRVTRTGTDTFDGASSFVTVSYK